MKPPALRMDMTERLFIVIQVPQAVNTLLALLAAFTTLGMPSFQSQSQVSTHQVTASDNSIVSSLHTMSAAEESCGVQIDAAPPQPRQINIVLDDSGSMFASGTGPLDRWSNAKYSLEVFAAMLDQEDRLNVYRTSDFGSGNSPGPAVSMAGDEPASQRVSKIHLMHMQGGGTPYDPVTSAIADLSSSSAPDRWLVVLSDGEFTDVPVATVESDFAQAVSANQTETTSMRVAFLAIGDEAPQLANNPSGGVFFEHAKQTEDLLDKMTGFSNLIFARSLLPQSTPGNINADIDLDEVLVFAQGEKVSIGAFTQSGKSIEAVSEVEVTWSDNPEVMSGGVKVPAVPNKGLNGKLSQFENLLAGSAAVDAKGAKTIDIFYKPRATFGIELRDSSGKKVEADKIVGGAYTVHYGFMDRDCNFIESDLLGDVSYTASVVQNGETVVEAFTPGDTIDLSRGDAQFNVSASFLNGNHTQATIDLKVLQPAQPSSLEASDAEFLVSKLNDYKMPQDAMQLEYFVDNGGKRQEFSAEEWATISADSINVSSDKNIEFEVQLGEKPGEVFVLPKAPGADVYAADTGEIPVSIQASHVYDEQLSKTSYSTTVQITNDISFFDRLVNWFLTVGWKWLLALLVLIVLAGYVFRKRLPRKMKNRPLVEFRPKRYGTRPTQSSGRVTRNRGSSFVPYAAQTATIRYIPVGTVPGVVPFKVKAAGGGRMHIANWKDIAKKGNVAIDGELLTKESTRAPLLRGTSTVTVHTKDGNFTCSLDQSLGSRK